MQEHNELGSRNESGNGYGLWILIGLCLPVFGWIYFFTAHPLIIYWFSTAALGYPLLLWVFNIGNKKLVQVPLDFGSVFLILTKTGVLLLMMNP